jgi:hypothetical protein
MQIIAPAERRPVTACAVAIAVLLFVDIPGLHQIFKPTVPRIQ